MGRLEAEVKRLKTEINFMKNSSKGNNPPRGGEHQSKSPPRRTRRSGMGSGMGSGDVFLEDRKEASAVLLL